MEEMLCYLTLLQLQPENKFELNLTSKKSADSEARMVPYLHLLHIVADEDMEYWLSIYKYMAVGSNRWNYFVERQHFPQNPYKHN